MSEPSAALKKILVIDDDKSACLFFESVLKRDGFEVILEYSGEEGLIRIKSESFDLVILDLMMPRMSGYEVLSEIQQSGMNIPVFIITARALNSGTVEMIRSDPNVWEFWNKPIDPKRLVSRIRELVETPK